MGALVLPYSEFEFKLKALKKLFMAKTKDWDLFQREKVKHIKKNKKTVLKHDPPENLSETTL